MMRIEINTLTFKPKTSSKLELAYALMAEAENQKPGEVGRFRAMDCHSDILDLADSDYGVYQAIDSLGMRARIGSNQHRLGI